MDLSENDTQYPQALLEEPVPLFEARSTQGIVNIEEYRGKWVVLFSHPADFTPVCTSEFVAFARKASAFADLDCVLIGLSVDSVYAHLAWIERIEEDFGVAVDFPIIEDVSMAISRAYGMIHPASSSTAAVRSVFVIDPDSVLKCLYHYPVSVGRSVDEILRTVQALQATRQGGMIAPAGWQPGDDLSREAPVTHQQLKTARKSTTSTAWYAAGGQ